MAPQTPLEDALISPSTGRVHHVFRRRPPAPGSQHSKSQEGEVLGGMGVSPNSQLAACGDGAASELAKRSRRMGVALIS
jgi:hypothetical protein